MKSVINCRNSLFAVLLNLLAFPLMATAQCPAGELVIADAAAFGIVRVPPVVSSSQTVIPGFLGATGVTSIGQKLYVMDNFNGNLYSVNCNSGVKTLLTTVFSAYSIEADPVTGIIYILDTTSIRAYDPVANTSTIVVSGLDGPIDVAVDQNGCIVAGEIQNTAQRVRRFPTPGRCPLVAPVTVVAAPDIVAPGPLDVHRATGDIYVADGGQIGVIGQRIIKIPAGGSPFVLTAPDVVRPFGLAINQDTGQLFATESQLDSDSRVVEVGTISGNVSILNQGNNIQAPFNITVMGPECGNGVVESGEQCDDGNTLAGDCCSPGCQYEPAQTSCDDGLFCNGAEACTAVGECVATGEPFTCDDQNPCTEDSCSEEEFDCINAIVEDGTSCDDGSACTTGESCTLGQCEPAATVECPITEPCSWTRCEPALGCVSTPGPAPASAVIGGGPANFSFKNKPNNKLDLIKWTMNKTDAVSFPALGNPVMPFGTEYGVCFWQDARSSGGGNRTGNPFYSSLVMPAQNDCGPKGDKACWGAMPKAKPAQFNYSDGGSVVGEEIDENGVKQLIVKSGGDGKGKLQFQAKGENLPDIGSWNTNIQFELPVVAQMCNSRGTCWQSVFETSLPLNPGPKKNVPSEFNMTVK